MAQVRSKKAGGATAEIASTAQVSSQPVGQDNHVQVNFNWHLSIYDSRFRKEGLIASGISAELRSMFQELYRQEYGVMDLIDERYVLLSDQFHVVEDEDQRLVRHRCDGWTWFIDFPI